MVPIYQNLYGELENSKGNKYSVSAYMRFLHEALQLLDKVIALHKLIQLS